jgi:hypothetical protein
MSAARMTGPMRATLLRLPPPWETPQVRPKWTHRVTIERLLGLGLIEEVSPGLYRRTAAGQAALDAHWEEAHQAWRETG